MYCLLQFTCSWTGPWCIVHYVQCNRVKPRLAPDPLKNKDTTAQRVNSSTVGCSMAQGSGKHLLNVLRTQTEPITREKRSPWSVCPPPVSGQLLMTCGSLPSSSLLTAVIGWVWSKDGDVESYSGNKKPTWLTHVVYKGIHAGVGVRRWTSLFVCVCVLDLWQLFNINIFIFRYVLPTTGVF